MPIIHGERMRDALQKQGTPVEWIVYQEEGHGFLLETNRYDFYSREGAFLAKDLAGRAVARPGQFERAAEEDADAADGPRLGAQRQRARQRVFEAQRVGRDREALLVDERQPVDDALAERDDLSACG